MNESDIIVTASRYAEFLIYHLGFENASLYVDVLHSHMKSKKDIVSASAAQCLKDFQSLNNSTPKSSSNG